MVKWISKKPDLTGYAAGLLFCGVDDVGGLGKLGA
jgi:hypothetical protein